jgi:hypothetical protein
MKMRAEIYRRIELLFGLVPSFLRRLDEAGEILDWKPPAPGEPARGAPRQDAPPERPGTVVCRYGPVGLHNPSRDPESN